MYSIKSFIIGIILTIKLSHSFYFSIQEGKTKCFNTVVYKNQKLLVQIETPILQPGYRVIIKVQNGGKSILNQQLQNLTAKFTLPKEATVVTNQIQSQKSFDYLTCIQYQTNVANPNNSIIISLVQVTNFDHIISKRQKQVRISDVKLSQIDGLSIRITELNKQQIEIHQKYEVKERENDNKVIEMKQKIHMYCVLECLIAIASSAAHIYFLNKYLSDNYLI